MASLGRHWSQGVGKMWGKEPSILLCGRTSWLFTAVWNSTVPGTCHTLFETAVIRGVWRFPKIRSNIRLISWPRAELGRVDAVLGDVVAWHPWYASYLRQTLDPYRMTFTG